MKGKTAILIIVLFILVTMVIAWFWMQNIKDDLEKEASPDSVISTDLAMLFHCLNFLRPHCPVAYNPSGRLLHAISDKKIGKSDSV